MGTLLERKCDLWRDRLGGCNWLRVLSGLRRRSPWPHQRLWLDWLNWRHLWRREKIRNRLRPELISRVRDLRRRMRRIPQDPLCPLHKPQRCPLALQLFCLVRGGAGHAAEAAELLVGGKRTSAHAARRRRNSTRRS